MGAITVYKFDTPDGAGQMLDLVKDLTNRQLITLDDAAIVTWPQGKKKPKAQHLQEKKQHARALGGAFWGMLFGLIFGVPFFGMALGAGFSSLSGESPDYGISKDFINELLRRNRQMGRHGWCMNSPCQGRCNDCLIFLLLHLYKPLFRLFP